ncbi:MAG: iron donor protein CyaY [Burkholderiaceae bacterium]
MNSPNDLQFMDRAEALLQTIERECDRINEQTDADIDNQRSGGMVTLTFSNRSQIVVNLQKPLHEIWLAAKSGGYHFRFDDHCWRDTKNPVAGEFFACLSQAASEQSGRVLVFGAGAGAART